MDWDYLRGVSQNWVAQLIGWIVVGGGGAAIIGWAKSKERTWVTPLLYGLAAFVLIFIGLNQAKSFLSSPPSSTATPTVNESELENTIEKWLSINHIDKGKFQLENAHFALGAKTKSGGSLAVYRWNDNAYLLYVNENRFFTNEDKAKLKKLPQVRKQKFTVELAHDLAVMQVNQAMNDNSITVWDSTPIKDLTEDRLLRLIDKVDFASVAAQAKVHLLLLDSGTPQ